MEIKLLGKKTAPPCWVPSYVTKEELPGHTFIAVNDSKVVAIAGLRLCEGPVCMLDSLATDQSQESHIRSKAIDFLVDTIKAKAVELGFKTIICFSQEPSIINRSFAHGFKLTHQAMLVKEL
jgi:hypothetical protein